MTINKAILQISRFSKEHNVLIKISVDYENMLVIIRRGDYVCARVMPISEIEAVKCDSVEIMLNNMIKELEKEEL